LGEEHHLGCDVLETYLTIKGYKVYNIGTSIPAESVLGFIENNKPDAVLISITMEDNLLAAQRLIKKIKGEYEIPILVGGRAVQAEKIPKFDAQVISDIGLENIPKTLRKVR